ncbi:hypothetical protein B0H10DRAFT_1963588 [Mycena sp. CBHHK59/15]|nr:hypothetical protein B0H10DRAFT_1963588 [Mycena sp. CBHHK59/15]
MFSTQFSDNYETEFWWASHALPTKAKELRRGTRKRETDKLTWSLTAEKANNDGNPFIEAPKRPRARAPRVKVVPESISDQEDDDYELPDLVDVSDSSDDEGGDDEMDIDNDEITLILPSKTVPARSTSNKTQTCAKAATPAAGKRKQTSDSASAPAAKKANRRATVEEVDEDDPPTKVVFNSARCRVIQNATGTKFYLETSHEYLTLYQEVEKKASPSHEKEHQWPRSNVRTGIRPQRQPLSCPNFGPHLGAPTPVFVRTSPLTLREQTSSFVQTLETTSGHINGDICDAWPEVADNEPLSPTLMLPLAMQLPPPGDWLRQPCLIGTWLDVIILNAENVHQGRYQNKVGVIRGVPPKILPGEKGVICVLIGNVAATNMHLKVQNIFPLTTTEFDGSISKADAKPIISVLGTQVIIIGADMTGDKVWIGNRGFVAPYGTINIRGHSIHFPESSICRSDPFPHP